MPRVIDYEQVQQTAAATGLVSLYYNSGAFGFPPGVATHSVGWIGGPDASIRPAALALCRQVFGPLEATLADLAVKVWADQLAGPVWLMPKSHWAYELDFGSHDWLPAALESAGATPSDVAHLNGRHDGAALEFEPAEAEQFRILLRTLLQRLFGNDFLLAFPGRPAVCTVHHHKQLWWTTTDAGLHAALDRLIARA